jgi:hypothetical protein
MSDSRIHLSISYHSTPPEHPPFDQWINVCIGYPTLEEKKYLKMIFYDIENKIKGLEALVRNLAANNKTWRAICPRCKSWNQYTTRIKDYRCWNCENLPPYMEWEFVYDTKLKVTFVFGTFSIWFEEPYIRVIEPLQPIEKVCKDLGVEINYVQQ